MFDRSRIDNATNEQGALSAEIALDDGHTETGKFIIPTSKGLAEVLNSAGGFIDFESLNGERRLIAKASLRSVRLIAPPPAGQLTSRVRDLDGFDPHTVLGVKRDAEWDAVKAAYLELSKRYHPDRYATAQLPQEVADYLAAMARRINAAFGALESARQSTRVIQRQRATPVYQTPGRA